MNGRVDDKPAGQTPITPRTKGLNQVSGVVSAVSAVGALAGCASGVIVGIRMGFSEYEAGIAVSGGSYAPPLSQAHNMLPDWVPGLIGGAIGSFLGIVVVVFGSLPVEASVRLIRNSSVGTRGLVRLAVIIAGRKRAWRDDEWLADLAVGAVLGNRPPPRARRRYAAGLVWGAVRLRAGDLTHAMSRLLYWMLAEPRAEIMVLTVTACTAGYFLHTQGLAGLISNLENVLAAASLVGVPALWLRHRREIPSARRRRDRDRT